MIKIDYDVEVKEHHKMLISKLRDFGSKNLQYWVPDENILNSLLSMIFSITENNINSFNISINKNTIGKQKLNYISEKLSNIADINTSRIDDKINFEINSVNKDKLELLSKEISGNRKHYKNQPIKNFIKKNYFNTISKENLKKIKNLYFKALSDLDDLDDLDIINKESIPEKKNFVKIKYNENLFYLNVENDKVQNIYLNDNFSKNDNKFLSYLFRANKNLPIFEFCEHGLLRLESFLRPKQIRKYIQGSISQVFVRLLFSNLQEELYKAWKKLKDEKNPNHKKNLYDLKLKETWIKLPDADKILHIKKSIKEFNKSINSNLINFLDLEDQFRVIVDFNENNSIVFEKKPILLLDFEKFIKDQIDKRLEVFYKELKDENKLRLKNSPI